MSQQSQTVNWNIYAVQCRHHLTYRPTTENNILQLISAQFRRWLTLLTTSDGSLSETTAAEMEKQEKYRYRTI